MRQESYWDLFWQTGLPEAWVLTRPGEGYLFSADPAAPPLPVTRTDPPGVSRQAEQPPEQID